MSKSEKVSGRKCALCQATAISITKFRTMSSTSVDAEMKCSECGFRWGERARVSCLNLPEVSPLEVLFEMAEPKETGRHANKRRKKKKSRKVYYRCLKCDASSIRGGYVQVERDGYSAEGLCGVCQARGRLEYSRSDVYVIDDRGSNLEYLRPWDTVDA